MSATLVSTTILFLAILPIYDNCTQLWTLTHTWAVLYKCYQNNTTEKQVPERRQFNLHVFTCQLLCLTVTCTQCNSLLQVIWTTYDLWDHNMTPPIIFGSYSTLMTFGGEIGPACMWEQVCYHSYIVIRRNVSNHNSYCIPDHMPVVLAIYKVKNNDHDPHH